MEEEKKEFSLTHHQDYAIQMMTVGVIVGCFWGRIDGVYYPLMWGMMGCIATSLVFFIIGLLQFEKKRGRPVFKLGDLPLKDFIAVMMVFWGSCVGYSGGFGSDLHLCASTLFIASLYLSEFFNIISFHMKPIPKAIAISVSVVLLIFGILTCFF